MRRLAVLPLIALIACADSQTEPEVTTVTGITAGFRGTSGEELLLVDVRGEGSFGDSLYVVGPRTTWHRGRLVPLSAIATGTAVEASLSGLCLDSYPGVCSASSIRIIERVAEQGTRLDLTAADDVHPCIENADAYESHPVHRDFDDDMADVARATPGGFGGIFYRDGVHHAFLVDLSQADLAEPVLRDAFDVDTVAFVQGRYDWLELISCQRALYQDSALWRVVSGADIDDNRNRLFFGVPDLRRHEAAVREAVQRADVPQSMVEVGEMGVLIPY